MESNGLTVVPQAQQAQLSPTVSPTVWNMIERVARAAYESRKVGVNSAGEAAIKFLFCYENGLALSTANTGLYIVNGRLTAQSNIIAAQIRRHPNYDYRIKALDDHGCTIEILRRDPVSGEMRVEGEASFTEQDAVKAGLANKDNYKGYPSDMFFNRALARAQRRYAPDVFSQTVYAPEEMGLRVDDNGDVIEGSWRTAPEPAPGPAMTGTTPVTLTDLVAQYGAERILEANGGTIPGTDEEIARVAEILTEAA